VQQDRPQPGGDRVGRIDAGGTAAALAAMLGWSAGPLAIRYLALDGHLDAWSQNLWRYSFGLLFLLPVLVFYVRRGRVGARVWRRAIVPGVANVIMQCFWAQGFYYIEAGFASLLCRTTLIWTAAFSLIYFRDERGLVKSRRFWASLVLGLAGVAGVIWGREGFAAIGTLTGILLVLATAVTWAIYTVSARIAFADIDSRVGFSVVAVYTVAGLAVAAALFSQPQKVFGLLEMSGEAWLVVDGSGFVCISLAHILYYAAMRRIGATIPALILSLVPLVVVMLSRILFGERLTTLQTFSGAVLVAGCASAVWAQEHLKRAAP